MKEKKPMKKGIKIFLGIVGVVLAIAICFGCIGLYLKNEQSKPVFALPDLEPLPSVSALPETVEDAASYIDGLFEKMTAADDVEGDWHTDVHLGEIKTPFADADNAIVQFVREQAPGQIAALYPSAAELVMSQTEDAPAFKIDTEKVLEYNGRQGEGDPSAFDDSANYYLDFTLQPDDVDAEAIKKGDIYAGVAAMLEPAVTVEDFTLTPESETVSCKVDRVSDDLLGVTITKNYTVKATIRLQDAYKALLDSETAEVELPYETVEFINFHHYGVRFTERHMAVKKGDMKALPINATVHSTATKEDYILTFESSVPDVLRVEEDGVLYIDENCDTPVVITLTLQYDGHTYSDRFTVYITEMEVKTDV